MPSKYQIKRQNRDRRGGHKSSARLKGMANLMGPDGHLQDVQMTTYGTNYLTQVERALIKREGKRLARRQHKKALIDAVVSYQEDLLMAWTEAGHQDEYDERWAFWECEDDTYPDDDDNDGFDPYMGWDDDYLYGDDYGYPTRWEHQRDLLDLLIVRSHDEGKTIAEVLQENGLGYLLD